MTPAIRASQIPVPARLAIGTTICSICSCPWSMLQGAPNLREVECERRSCSCHDYRFSVALYEGSSPDLDQLTSSGAQE